MKRTVKRSHLRRRKSARSNAKRKAKLRRARLRQSSGSRSTYR